MNKQYIRNGLEYYMKVEPMGGEEYEYQMLMKNTIPNLLPLQVEQVNHRQYLRYTASGVKPFWIVSEKMWISGRQLSSIVDGLLETIKEVKRYLLTADNLVLDPECVFLDLSKFQLHFLYVPGYEQDIVKQMVQLMEHLLGKIDYEDAEGVVFAYGMYRILKEPTVNMEEIQSYAKQFAKEPEEKEKNIGEEEFEDKKLEPQIDTKTISRGDSEKVVHPVKSGIFILSGIVWIILFIGISGILYLIYRYGIEIWKRNVLLVLGFSLMVDSIVLWVQWKKRREEKEVEAVFQTTGCGEIQETVVLNMAEETNQLEEINSEGYFQKKCRLVEVGEGNCREIIIVKMPFVIGNYSTGVDYRLQERQISRLHAVISEKEDGFYIKDLHSTNGTYVNEIRLESEKEQRIQNNDWITFADLRFRFIIA